MECAKDHLIVILKPFCEKNHITSDHVMYMYMRNSYVYVYVYEELHIVQM